MLRTCAAVLVLAATCAPASAGVVMEFTDRSPGETPEISKAFVGADRARIESGGQVMIFRGDKQVLWIVDPAANTYMTLTKDGIPGMADAMKELEASLAGMSPEERAMVEGMMKRQAGGAPGMPAAAPPATTWKANGTSDTIGGHACRGWDGTRSGRLEEQICAAEWTTFGLTESDFAALQQLGEFMKTMTGPMTQQGQKPLMEPAVPGIPLRSVSKSPQGDHVHEVTRIEKSDVAGALFELPAGAKEQAMDGAPGPRGRR